MLIGGLQKLSLLDYPDKICCTIFTIGCNYKCPFCHNSSMIQKEQSKEDFSLDQIFAFLKKRQGILDGVCVTGGEPMLQDGLEDFIYEIKTLGFSVKLDTNGSNPQKLRHLIDSKLVDYVAMDVKNTPCKYGVTVGVPGFDIAPVKESISILLTNIVPYEFRTTVVRELHTGADIRSIADWIKGSQHYYLQSYMDSDDVLTRGLSSYSKEEMYLFLESIQPFVPNAALRGI